MREKVLAIFKLTLLNPTPVLGFEYWIGLEHSGGGTLTWTSGETFDESFFSSPVALSLV